MNKNVKWILIVAGAIGGVTGAWALAKLETLIAKARE